MIKNKLVKPSPHQGEYAVHLTCYLSLRRHDPDQVYVANCRDTKLCVPSCMFSDAKYYVSAFGFIHNNGFDLSLSFSLIAQSKAPLENYLVKIGFDFGFFTIVYFQWYSRMLRSFGISISKSNDISLFLIK